MKAIQNANTIVDMAWAKVISLNNSNKKTKKMNTIQNTNTIKGGDGMGKGHQA